MRKLSLILLCLLILSGCSSTVVKTEYVKVYPNKEYFIPCTIPEFKGTTVGDLVTAKLAVDDSIRECREKQKIAIELMFKQ